MIRKFIADHWVKMFRYRTDSTTSSSEEHWVSTPLSTARKPCRRLYLSLHLVLSSLIYMIIR